jgi:UDP-glucose 4-epimerase
MRFLITGAAGFLGSALSNYFAKQGHTVRGIDDLSAGSPENLIPDVHLTRGDINDRPKLWSLLQDIDCVYHLAARVIVPESVLYPREYNLVNVGGTVTLMEAMRDVGVSRVVFVSSGAIYGDQSEQPVTEKAHPNPQSPYAVSKLSAEYYVNTIGKLWGIETVILRVFNAYGPGQQLPPVHPPVIPNFLHQAALNGTLVVHGDGEQTRDYVYIDDVVRGMSAAAFAPNVNQSIINIGSGVETSINHLIRSVIGTTGGDPEIVHSSKHKGGPARMCADLTQAKEKLGYEPTIPLQKGLELTFRKDTSITQSKSLPQAI